MFKKFQSINKLFIYVSLQEHILECQDIAEIERIKVNVEKSREALQTLGYPELTFEDFFGVTYNCIPYSLCFWGYIFAYYVINILNIY